MPFRPVNSTDPPALPPSAYGPNATPSGVMDTEALVAWNFPPRPVTCLVRASCAARPRPRSLGRTPPSLITRCVAAPSERSTARMVPSWMSCEVIMPAATAPPPVATSTSAAAPVTTAAVRDRNAWGRFTSEPLLVSLWTTGVEVPTPVATSANDSGSRRLRGGGRGGRRFHAYGARLPVVDHTRPEHQVLQRLVVAAPRHPHH